MLGTLKAALDVPAEEVLSAGWDGNLRLWEASSGRHLTALRAGPKPLSACAFTPDGRRWVYLDIGRYNGLAETENEAIPYRFEAGPGAEQGPAVIAGPTCDGDDVLYQQTPYELPLSLLAGDRLDIPDTGAYTASYSSVAFNGIEPLRAYCLD